MTTPPRILLVDDVRLVLTSLRRVLERAGFHVFACESASEALALLERESVDVVVSDFMMPVMNGVEMLQEIAIRWPRVRRCLLTAQAEKEVLDAALADGLIHAAFTKPWDNRSLVEQLQQLATAAGAGAAAAPRSAPSPRP